METREEAIKELKKNTVPTYYLSSLKKEILQELKDKHIGNLLVRNLNDGAGDAYDKFITPYGGYWEIEEYAIYRIAGDYVDDYKEEPEAPETLSFDIDWNRNDSYVMFKVDDGHFLSVSHHRIEIDGTKYKFKHFEFDLESETACRADTGIIFIGVDGITVWSTSYNKNESHKYKTIFANRIVFQKEETQRED